MVHWEQMGEVQTAQDEAGNVDGLLYVHHWQWLFGIGFQILFEVD